MATHTVYGCKLADGTFEFSDTASGCEGVTITGCLVDSGEHKGKVAITHDYDEGCSVDDYACFDGATGQWKFEADDDCCGCEACTVEDFASCISPFIITPRYFRVTLVGAQLTCQGDEVDFDGIWICECVGTFAASVWRLTNGNRAVFLQHDTAASAFWRVAVGYNSGDGFFRVCDEVAAQIVLGALDVCTCICDDDCPDSWVAYWVACDALGNECTC